MSGVVPGPPAQVEEPVAFSTQITTAVAEDDSKCFSIIVIMASRPFRSTNTTTALTTTQTFYMISVKHTKGSYSRSGPRRVRLRTVSPIAYCTHRKIDPVLTELALSNILKKLNNILEPILDLRY